MFISPSATHIWLIFFPRTSGRQSSLSHTQRQGRTVGTKRHRKREKQSMSTIESSQTHLETRSCHVWKLRKSIVSMIYCWWLASVALDRARERKSKTRAGGGEKGGADTEISRNQWAVGTASLFDTLTDSIQSSQPKVIWLLPPQQKTLPAHTQHLMLMWSEPISDSAIRSVFSWHLDVPRARFLPEVILCLLPRGNRTIESVSGQELNLRPLLNWPQSIGNINPPLVRRANIKKENHHPLF